ncbi:MAG: mandelate racemase/muconate lactonizing enzyme family protein, partial [Deinococcus sp.]|nr:mandelate racemase/muconate lactonizing enzyme family protein [Deinococcus sp.]
MKITDLTATVVRVPYPHAFHPAWFNGQPQPYLESVVVEVHTDTGLTGIGASSTGAGHLVKRAVETVIKPMLIGMDPRASERWIIALREAALFTVRPWLVGIALWDIIGKAAGMPLYLLWGGAQDRLLAYASTGELASPDTSPELALRFLEEGFKAIKLRLHHETIAQDVACVEAVRNAVGDRMAILVDANQANVGALGGPVWDYSRAKATALELEQLGVLWLEEPLRRLDYSGLSRLCREVDLAIAGGELNLWLEEMYLLWEQDCYDILQPDCTWVEDVGQLRKIA